MNQYQKYIAENLKIDTRLADYEFKQTKRGSYKEDDRTAGAVAFSFNNGIISITQNPNYHVHEYELTVTHPSIDKIWITKGGKKITGDITDETTRTISIDFNKKSPSLFISFKDNLTDPIELPIEYTDADKKEWDELIKAEKAEELAKKANIIVTNGISFVNIIFRPIDITYHHAIATLYFEDHDENDKSLLQIMGDFESKEGMFFIPICNIGYGKYMAILKQYDKDDNLIYESEKISFSYEAPSGSKSFMYWIH